MRYTVIVVYDPGASVYGVTVPSLAGCTSVGGTIEAALANAREAIELYLKVLLEEGKPIPADRDIQAIRIDVPDPAGHQAA